MAPGTARLHIYSWNTKLTRYIQAGQPLKAVELFQQIQQEGMIPDTFTFV
jgi:pentatricopeptide repeat protein